jgi:hypothetical protein
MCKLQAAGATLHLNSIDLLLQMLSIEKTLATNGCTNQSSDDSTNVATDESSDQCSYQSPGIATDESPD